MTGDLKLSDDQAARVQALAARTRRTSSEVVADALDNGHSLSWQERFLDHVDRGLATADRGEFASADEIERVLTKHRPG